MEMESAESWEMVKCLSLQIAQLEQARGISVPWFAALQEMCPPEIPGGFRCYTPSEVINAMGRALTQVGIPNNLERPCPEHGEACEQ